MWIATPCVHWLEIRMFAPERFQRRYNTLRIISAERATQAVSGSRDQFNRGRTQWNRHQGNSFSCPGLVVHHIKSQHEVEGFNYRVPDFLMPRLRHRECMGALDELRIWASLVIGSEVRVK